MSGLNEEFATKPKAVLVYDGGDTVDVPEEMGTPLPNQMQGSPLEQLCELAGRVCYDSLGQGRPSFDNFTDAGKRVQGYHAHIHEVRHFSVYRHAWLHLSLQVPSVEGHMANLIANRPGVNVRWSQRSENSPWILLLNLNLEAVFSWQTVSERKFGRNSSYGLFSNGWLRGPLSEVAPNLVQFLHKSQADVAMPKVEYPSNTENQWISLYLSGSRGFSHEMVRHSYQCAPSQRSTRYCDEHESPWVHHPLVQQFLADKQVSCEEQVDLMRIIDEAVTRARDAYKSTNEIIYRYLEKKGYDKASCRKQARGAARGYLGNALETAMIFSASINQWKEIFRQRGGAAADAEIRCLAVAALKVIQKSRYGSEFSAYDIGEERGLPYIKVPKS